MNTLNAKAHKKSPYYAVTGRESVMPAERLYNKKPTAEFESIDVSGGEEHLLGSMVQQVPCGTGGLGFNSHG